MELDKFSGLNVRISPTAVIGNNVRIGDNTVVYDNVVIGDNTIICNDCVLGEPLNSYYSDMENYINPKTVIGSNSLIRSHSIIYADSIFGECFQTGNRVTIREKVKMGIHCSVGTLSDLQGYAEFGDYVRLHSNVHIGQGSNIGNYCWIFPYTVFTNDPTPPSNINIGPTVGDYSIIATKCVLLPGVNIGKHCLVGASTTVVKDVDDYKVVVGTPGKVVKDIRDILDRETGTPHYPWPYRFGRNMPWESCGYQSWISLQENRDDALVDCESVCMHDVVGGGKYLIINNLYKLDRRVA